MYLERSETFFFNIWFLQINNSIWVSITYKSSFHGLPGLGLWSSHWVWWCWNLPSIDVVIIVQFISQEIGSWIYNYVTQNKECELHNICLNKNDDVMSKFGFMYYSEKTSWLLKLGHQQMGIWGKGPESHSWPVYRC